VPGARPPGDRASVFSVEPVKPLDRSSPISSRCIREGRPPLVDGQTGLDALEVALEVRSRICH
jgi:hypothetical protein